MVNAQNGNKMYCNIVKEIQRKTQDVTKRHLT